MLEIETKGGSADPLQLLSALSQDVADARDVDQVYDAALRAIEGALGVRSSAILVFDVAGVMRFVAWRNLSEECRAAVEGHTPWPAGAADPQPVLVEDVRCDASLAELLPTIEGEGIRALGFVPLCVGGRLLGKFILYYGQPHSFTEQELTVARAIAANVGFAIDRHRAREERRQQQEHLEALFRSSLAGIAELDVEGRFLVVNRRFCELTGRSRAELLDGLRLEDVVHEDDREELAGCLGCLRDDVGHCTLEHRLVQPDGGERWLSISASALHRGPAFSGSITIVTDITERRRAENAVRESEERYRTLMDGLSVAVYTTDATGALALFNEAAAKMWGRSPEVGVDMWCGSWRIYHLDGEPMDLDECPMAVALREDRSVRGEEILVERPDGTRLVVLPHPTPLHDRAGRLVGAVNVLVDVTEEKRMQQALRDALRAKDDFLGQVSHELRTPLTQIGGNAEFLLRRGNDLSRADVRGSLEEIHAQTARMQRLVENMMILSRFERGVMPETEPLLLQHVLSETVSEFRAKYPATATDFEIKGELPPVETSASTIDQVVWNLLTNAQKYGPAEGPISVTACCTAGRVEVTVRDCGPGVPDEDLSRIFEPYFRAASTPAHAAGIGLGLSVCKRLIEAQQGEIFAARDGRGGMAFTVRLPALEAQAAD